MSFRPTPFGGRWLAATVALAGLLAGSSRASAETVSLLFDHTNGAAGVPVQYTIGGTTSTASPQPGPYYWQQTGSPINSNLPGNLATFCVELNQTFDGSATTYNVDPLSAIR